MMKYAKYIGTRPELRGRKALLCRDPRSRRHVFAQFNLKLLTNHWDIAERDRLIAFYCFGWHRFKRSEFTRDRSRSQAEGRVGLWSRTWDRPGHAKFIVFDELESIDDKMLANLAAQSEPWENGELGRSMEHARVVRDEVWEGFDES